MRRYALRLSVVESLSFSRSIHPLSFLDVTVPLAPLPFTPLVFSCQNLQSGFSYCQKNDSRADKGSPRWFPPILPFHCLQRPGGLLPSMRTRFSCLKTIPSYSVACLVKCLRGSNTNYRGQPWEVIKLLQFHISDDQLWGIESSHKTKYNYFKWLI